MTTHFGKGNQLSVLVQQQIKLGMQFFTLYISSVLSSMLNFVEYFVIDLIMDNKTGMCCGVLPGHYVMVHCINFVHMRW